jgi:hypothetical protein
MTCCDDMHEEYGQYANGDVQVGELPDNFNVKGKVAWYIYKGPYATLCSIGWSAFWEKYAQLQLTPRGSPGDIYICNPGCHEEDHQEEILTLIFCPVE